MERGLHNKIEDLEKEVLRLRRRLARIEVRDDLTGLYKRRFFEESLAREILRAKRHKNPLSLIMIGLRNLKREELMKQIGLLIRETLVREIDTPCRFSKQSLAIILPETTRVRALVVGQRIKGEIERVLGRGVDILLGVASYPYEATSKDGLIREARKDFFKKGAE